jgi:predicted DNA-binding protein
MHIYFYSNASDNDQNSQQILQYLRRVGATVISETSTKKVATEAGALPMDKVDALLIYGQKLDAQAGYWLAWAVSKNKDVLCLLPEGTKLDAALEHLLTDSVASKKLHLERYQAKDVLDKVANFLESFGQENLSELYNIKYTLRLSRKINEYLDWKSAATSIDKATWLRENIQGLMEGDKDWQSYLSTKFKIKK